MKHRFLILLLAILPIIGYGQGQQWLGFPTQLNGWYGGITANKFIRLPHAAPTITLFDSCGFIWFDSASTKALYYNDCANRIQLLSVKDSNFIKSFIGHGDTAGLASRSWVVSQLLDYMKITDTVLPFFFTTSDFNTAISNYFKQNGNTYSAPAILGTTDNYSLHFITNNTDRGSIDSVGNIFFKGKLFIFDKTPTIQSGYDTSLWTVDIGSGNKFVTGNRAFVQGENNYVSAPANIYVRGALNTVRGMIGGQHLYVDGRGNAIGDTLSSLSYDFVRGKSNTVQTNGLTLNFKNINGSDNFVWLRNNSLVNSSIYGSSNRDSSNNSGENFGSSIFGDNWTNRHKGTFFIGFPGSGRTSAGYTSMQDYETILGSLGTIKFFPNNVRNAGIIGLTGNWIFGDTVDNGTDRLQVKGSANITTNITVGSNVKFSSLTNGIGNAKVLTTDASGNLIFIPVDTTFNPHGLTLADFGVLPDYRRTWISHASGSHNVTSATGTFSATDVGKIMYIPRARQYLAYSTDTLGITGTITAFVNSSTVTIDSNISLTSIDSTMYFGTNWYDTLQYITNYCAAHNVGRLMADGAGTYLFCPKLSRTAATQSPEIRGIQITAPLVIEGAGYNTTYFKFSVEDDIHINTANCYQWNGIIDYTNGGFELRNMTLLAPDRACLSYTPADSSGAAVTVPSGFKRGSTVLKNVRIIGDSSGKKPNWRLSWPNGINVSTTDTLGQYTLNLENVAIQSEYQNITFFTPRGGKKNLIINHLKTHNSGSPLMGTLFANAATIISGSPTLTLHSTASNPNPSWYKFTSGIGSGRQYLIYLYNGVDTFSARMLTVVNDTVVTLSRNATANFTLANMQSKGTQNINYGEGQNAYIHPTITEDIDDWEAIDVYGLAIQNYSSHGGIPTVSEHRYYSNCRSSVGPDGYTDLGWLLGNGSRTTNILRNCDFQIYSLGHAMQIKAYNTNFRNNSPFYDTSSLYNCSGSLYAIGAPMQLNIYGGNYSNIYIHSNDSGTTNIYGDSVTLIANNSTHSGVVNILSPTTIGSITGVGLTKVYYPTTTEQIITDGATVTLNGLNGVNQKVTLGGNRTLAFSNTMAGFVYILKVVQDGTGSKTLSYPATVKWTNGVAPTLTTTAAAVDVISFYYDGTNYYGTYGNDFK